MKTARVEIINKPPQPLWFLHMIEFRKQVHVLEGVDSNDRKILGTPTQMTEGMSKLETVSVKEVNSSSQILALCYFLSEQFDTILILWVVE